MAKKSKNRPVVPHQELYEFLTTFFGGEFAMPKEYYYDFDVSPSLYLSLHSRHYKTPYEADQYASKLDVLFKNTTNNLGYQLRGLHVRTHSHKERFAYIHTSHVFQGIEKAYGIEYLSNFGTCNYFECELPESRISDVLYGSCRAMINMLDDVYVEEDRLLLNVPLRSVYGMIFSKP